MITKKSVYSLFCLMGLMALSQTGLAAVTQAPPYKATITNGQENLPLSYASVVWSPNIYKIQMSPYVSGAIGSGASNNFDIGINYDDDTSKNGNYVTFYYLLKTTTNPNISCGWGDFDEQNCAGCIVTFVCDGLQKNGVCSTLRASADSYGKWSGNCGTEVRLNNANSINYTMGT